MNRTLVIILLSFTTLCARAQDALYAFTNRADQLLRPKWGFGVNEIPIYCSTNPLVRYNGGIHYLLQQAVNAYDQTNHTSGDFDFPSVLRPQFTVVSNNQSITVIITNWVEVTNDYASIMARPFKTANDPTISNDDNVWGVGMVIGFKPAVPIFNEFSYANNFTICRKLQFKRPAPATPPNATNQMYLLSLSNVFGCSALNTWTQALPRDVTVYLTNSATFSLVNEQGRGVTALVTKGTAQEILSNTWAGYSYGHTNMYEVFTNAVVTLPLAAYTEIKGAFLQGDPSFFEQYVGLPVHSWFVQVTNQLLYALIDNSSGRILDFVNYDKFGTSLDMMQKLQSLTTLNPSPWQTNGANPYVGPSPGLLNQIAIATGSITMPDYNPQPGVAEAFASFLNGTDTSLTTTIDCPYQPSASIQQVATWWVATPFPDGLGVISPGDHFTIDEMAGVTSVSSRIPIMPLPPFNLFSNLGHLPPIQITQFTSDPNTTTLQFSAYTDGQYGIWSSSDLANWGFVGVATKLTNNVYGFSAPANGNTASLYFQARKL